MQVVFQAQGADGVGSNVAGLPFPPPAAGRRTYFRAPRCRFLSLVCRRLCALRLGFEMMNVPLPWYSA